jgi:GNAT superfamily N-acetyltransferase
MKKESRQALVHRPRPRFIGDGKRKDTVRIDYLADHEKFVSPLVQWHHQEWSYLRPGDTIDARTARLRAACGHCGIPTVFVAFTGKDLLGSAMLIAHDMDNRVELSPWLAGVFVRPDRRKEGLGATLVQRVVEEARVLGIRRLYLYTPTVEQFYVRLGWLNVERTNYRGVSVVVMTKEVPCAE